MTGTTTTCILALAVAALVQLAATASYNIRATPPSVQGIDKKLADTVRALDTDGNGKVDQSEITVFAKSQGLSAQEVLADFKELDVNNDGALDTTEIGPLFGAGDAGQSTTAKEVVAKAPPASAETPALPVTPTAAVAAVKADAELAVEAAAAPIHQPTRKNSMDLDLVALDRDAQEQAGGIIASQLAKRAQVLVARGSADEQKAEAFDVEVRTLRGNATALLHKANEETRKAAHDATVAVSEKSLAKLKKLQEQEHKSEVDATERRGAAKQAMARVRQVQASLRHS